MCGLLCAHHAVTTPCTALAGGQSERPLTGLTAVVLGTGGAARALAFGAAARGANVVVAGRRLERANDLAYTVSESCADGATATACSVREVQNGELESMHVLMNTTPLGMVGERENDTPVPVETLAKVLSSVNPPTLNPPTVNTSSVNSPCY